MLLERRSAPAVSAAAALSAAATLVAAQAAPQPFALADLARIVSIATPQLSPDGRRAIALISRVDLERDRSADEIDLIDLATGEHRGPASERSGVTSPRWSPDGKRIAFIADSGTGESARPQIFVLQLDGGDPTRVSAAPDGVDAFVWRPDGQALAYTTIDSAPKRTGSARYVDADEVGNGSYLLPGAAVTDWIADSAIAGDLDADLVLFHGSPFIARNRARWVHAESITYVNDVTTPVLLMADRGDARVANVSSYEFFHALRDLGKPVQFIVSPVDGHFPHDPARTADVYARWMSYIGDHFKL